MSQQLSFSIVGTGMIATALADSMHKAPKVRLAAVSSRTQAKADAFVSERPGVAAVAGTSALLARQDVDAVYVATPTHAKEEIALAAIAAGKHVLVDKPFADAGSLERMTSAAAAAGVLFMDATHFVHHPRTAALRSALPELIGEPRSLHTAFYFPLTDHDNIRFDPSQEPTGAVGDMAWYSMRAIVEYLQPRGEPTTLAVTVERHAETGAVVRASGLLGFEDGKASTLDVGYTAGTVIMDLDLLGTSGMVTMDDFVLDWHNSFSFQNDGIRAGFVHRSGMATRGDFTQHETPSELPADALMVERFAELVASGDARAAAAFVDASLRTQRLLDAAWAAVTG